MKKPIVVVGSLNMDLVVQSPRHPLPGETLLGSSFHTFPGGKGANQAVAAARLGAPVEMVGRVGQDGFGEALLKTAAADGVGCTFIRGDAGASSGVALITVDSAGENTIIVVSGANANLSPADVKAAAAAFSAGAILLTQLESPLETVQAAAELACEQGGLVILNPSPYQPLPDELLKKVDILVPNEGELALISGSKDVEEGISRLLRRGVRAVVVTMGGRGMLMARGEERLRLPAHKVQVVDTTAAGDAFLGGLAAALSDGLSLETACRWGNAAGALAATRRGAQPSLPNRAELETLL